MNDMERRKFEDSFKDAFQEAEVSPSESVWTAIELDLERAEGGKMKRRILFYKMLAAASVVFGMSVAGVGYYMMQSETSVSNGQLAKVNSLPAAQTVPEREPEGAATTLEINDLTVTNSVESKIIADNSNSKSSERKSGSSANNFSPAFNSQAGSASGSDQDLAGTNSGSEPAPSEVRTAEINSVPDQDDGLRSARVIDQTSMASIHSNGASNTSVKKLPARVKPETHLVNSSASEVDPVTILLAKAAQREKELADEDESKDEKNNSERLWTSVGVAAGAFSSTNSSVSPSVSAFNNTAGEQVKASGVAYSMGVSVGTRLSNRWVLQGGLNYQTQSSDYTANSVVGTSDFQNFYASSMNTAREENTKLLNTAPYSVNNNLQFVNVPLQAGYLVVNKKIGVQLNAGISTDLFLQNTITPESGSLEKSTQGAGDSSPYRTVNFSGLVGTELTYKFGTHYRLALNPGLRYPMNSIYKSSTGVEAAPLTFDVGLRFRYIFNQ